MKFKNTYILLALTLALGFYIYFFEFKKADKDKEKKDREERVIPGLDADRVRKLVFKNSFGNFVLEKDAQNIWQIQSPLQDQADDSTIVAMLNTLSSEKYEEMVTDTEVDMKPYGLSEAKVSLKIVYGTGESHTLLVGDNAPIAGKLYAKLLNEKRVLYCNQGLKYQLDKSLKDLRDKRIIKFSRDDVKFLSLKNNKTKKVSDLEKKDNLWKMSSDQSKADQDTVIGIINGVDSLRASDFVSEDKDAKGDLKKFDLDKPEVEVTLLDGNKKLLDIIYVGPKKQNYAYVITKNRKTIFQVYTGAADQFLKNPEDFTDKKALFEFNREEVKQVSLKTSLVDFEFTKKSDTWELVKGERGKVVNQMQMANLISKASEMRVSEFFPNPKLYDFNQPKGQLVLKNEKGNVLLDLKWGESLPKSKNTIVKTQRSDQPVAVESSLIYGLPAQTLLDDEGKK